MVIHLDTSTKLGGLAIRDGTGVKAPMNFCVKSGGVQTVIRVASKYTEFGKIISTIRTHMASGSSW